MTKTKIKQSDEVKIEIENIITLINPQFCAALEKIHGEENEILNLTRILRIFVKYLLYDQECRKREINFLSEMILEQRGKAKL
jgi:hypothetical protein